MRNGPVSVANPKPTMSSWEIQSWHAAVFFAALTAIMFFKILLGGAYPWEDLMEQEIPYRVFAADCLRHGIFPLWNPYTFCGMPFFAALQTAVLYPTNLLLTFFIGTGSLGSYWIEFFIVAHYWLAAFGMYFLCRNELKQSGWAALLAGITFGFSGIMLVHEIHQGMIFQFAWLPWVFFAMMRGARVRQTRWFILGGLLLGVSFLAGHPQITLYTFFALGILAVTMMVREWKESSDVKKVLVLALRSSLLAIIAVGLWAVQYLPAQEIAALAIRAESSFEFAATGSLQWQQLLTVIIPKYFGTSQASVRPSLPFWIGEYYNYWETCCYIGILPLVLAVIGAVRGKDAPHRLFLFIIAAFALAFALGSNFFVFPLFYQIPLFAKFRNPARIMYLFTFAAAIFAGKGFDYLTGENIAAQAAKTFLWRWLAIGVGLGVLLIALGSSMFDVPEKLVDGVNGQVWLFIFLWAAAIFLVWMLRAKIASANAVIIGMIVLTSADFLIFGAGYNDGTNDPKTVYNKTPLIIKKLRDESRDQLFRVRMRSPQYMLMERNQGPVDHISLIEGYNPLILQQHMPVMFSQEAQEDVMNVRYRISIDSARQTAGIAERSGYLPRACMFYQARVLDDSGIVHALMKDYDYRHILYLDKDPGVALPDTSAHPVSNVQVTNYTPNEIRIKAETSENGILFTSEIFYPDWKVYVDGVPAEVLRANSCLRAVALAKGTHEVVFRDEPDSFKIGAYISGGVLLLSILAFGFLSMRRKEG